MRTAMQELWDHLDDAERNDVYELGTQNLKRYIEVIYLEKEKNQIINSFDVGSVSEIEGEQYFNETFKTINP